MRDVRNRLTEGNATETPKAVTQSPVQMIEG